MAVMGTPLGLSISGETVGQFLMDTVNRELGWSTRPPEAGVQVFPCQSSIWGGTASVRPSHQGSLVSVFHPVLV